MLPLAIVQSIQVGSPHRYPLPDTKKGRPRSWQTSFFREPIAERRWLATTHLTGNAQADTKNHGALDQAVLVYAAAHYPRWQAELDRPDIGPGGFAENFTVSGLDESTTCLGDVYAVGEARVQVSGPRYPCVKISRRWGIPSLTARVAETGRTGWYCSVMQEGWVKPGLPFELVERPCPEVSIALINDFAHGRNRDEDAARDLVGCPLLHEWWRELISRVIG